VIVARWLAKLDDVRTPSQVVAGAAVSTLSPTGCDVGCSTYCRSGGSTGDDGSPGDEGVHWRVMVLQPMKCPRVKVLWTQAVVVTTMM